MTPLTIQQATHVHVELVADMWTRAADSLARRGMDQWQYPVKMTNIRAAIATKTCWLLTDPTTRPIGTITVDQCANAAMWFPEDHPDEALYLHRMITEPAVKGQEIGSALIDWAARR